MSFITINFEDILSGDTEVQRRCLDKLVEDIHEIKERTIYNFLKDSGSEDFLWSLVQLLSSEDIRLASNAAYVIGSLAETELGAERVLSITKRKRSSSIIQDLTKMLSSDDSETVMNAAGTLGTLAETSDGRSWMLQQSYIDQTISQITALLSYENNWVASNAALVLARVTISEEGCHKVLSHEQSLHVLTRLIYSLGNDIAGRGMNAAFAIGRLLDMNPGKERLLNLPDTEKMISSLCRMLIKGDMGSAKNACFALSCLSADKDGNQRVIGNNSFNDVLNRLLLLLANEEDVEAAWFAAMTLRTLTSQQRGVLKLRDNEAVLNALNKNFNKSTNTKELNEEITKTLEHLKKLDAPNPPTITIINPFTFRVTWDKVAPKSGAPVLYKLYEGSKLVYKGKDTETELVDLKPNFNYSYKLKVSSLGDDSSFSAAATVTTEEGTPSAPCGVRVVGTTTSQIRIAWSAPEQPNGVLRNYTVYLGDKLLDSVTETSYIVGRLQPSTSYTLHVRANTSKGAGLPASVEAKTHEKGAHAPGRPMVTVRGRNEVHVTWNPPAVPLGRISRYELLANKEVIYSGTDRNYHATNLIPDKEYSFTVCAVTNEGRCESDATKKRTSKDKSQAEPGRHASKTRSFKAKEFQLEKSKTQSSITVKKPKPTLKKPSSSIRPNSCSTSSSRPSVDRKSTRSPPPHDGVWASNRPSSVSTVSTSSSSFDKPSPPILTLNHSVVLGANPVDIRPALETRPQVNAAAERKPTAPSGGNGNVSLFFQKSNTEYPLRKKLSGKPPTNQKKFSIEPVTWKDILPTADTEQTALNFKKQGLTKPRRKQFNKLEALDYERSFVNLISQDVRGQRSCVPRMSVVDKLTQNRIAAVTSSHPLAAGSRREPRTKKRVLGKSSPSDSSSDEHPVMKKSSAADLARKLEPLTLEDAVVRNRLTVKLASTDRSFNFDDPKQIAGRLKTPSRGYWSDNEPYSTPKKINGILPSNYQAFKRAHRPTKTLRHDSPLLAETWLTELPAGGDKNKYHFIPTQFRTQPANLPKPGQKLESFVQQDLRQTSMKQYTKPKRHQSNRDVHSRRPMRASLIPKQTSTYVVNSGSTDTDRNRIHSEDATPYNGKYVPDDVRATPHILTTVQGDHV